MVALYCCDNTKALRNLGRDLPGGLVVSVKGGGQLKFTGYSRHLVGRRLAGTGVWKGKPVFIKLFFEGVKLKSATLNRARKEFRRELAMSKAIAEGAVSAPAVQDSGEIDGGGYWLVQELLPDVMSFKQCWDKASTSVRSDLWVDLLSVLARVYQVKLCQADAHLENFAYSNGKLYVLDAGGVKRVRFRSQFVSNLALVIAQFSCLEHGWMVDAVIKNSDFNKVLTLDELSKKTAISWRNRIRKLGRKTLRSSSLVSVIKGRCSTALCMRDQLTPNLHCLLVDSKSIDSLIEKSEVLKLGNSATVARVRLDGRSYVIKRYNIKNGWVRIKRTFKISRARRSWLGGHYLSWSGVSVSNPVAILEERNFGVAGKAYFICRDVGGFEALSYITDNGCSDELLNCFSRLWLVMHYTMISHGDMKATNFMTNGVDLSVIDLDAVRIHSGYASFSRAFKKDLVRFKKNWVGGNSASRIEEAVSDFLNV